MMGSRTRSQIEQANFIKQVKKYTHDLQQLSIKLLNCLNKCRLSNKNQAVLNQLNVKLSKIQLQIQKYKQAVNKMQNKIISRGGIRSIKDYIDKNYSMLIRESHQLLNICSNERKLTTEQDFRKIKEYQSQMENQWQFLNKRKNESFARIQNVTSISSYDNQNRSHDINKMASAQIQQQFLAIRLVAYKMYQNYNLHNHQKTYQQIQILKQEQCKLQKEITQLKELRMSLLSEEQKIQNQLAQVKKINELVGRRYFIENSRVQTHFTNY